MKLRRLRRDHPKEMLKITELEHTIKGQVLLLKKKKTRQMCNHMIDVVEKKNEKLSHFDPEFNYHEAFWRNYLTNAYWIQNIEETRK